MNWLVAIRELKRLTNTSPAFKESGSLTYWNANDDENWKAYKSARESIPKWLFSLLFKLKLI